jgi:hypothetical protein
MTEKNKEHQNPGHTSHQTGKARVPSDGIVKLADDKINTSLAIIPYEDDDSGSLGVLFSDDDVWLTQEQLAVLYGTPRPNITMHIKNIIKSKELDEEISCKYFLHDIKGDECIPTKHYNLDMIISLGYRVNSGRATKFRQWSTRHLKEQILKTRKSPQKFTEEELVDNYSDNAWLNKWFEKEYCSARKRKYVRPNTVNALNDVRRNTHFLINGSYELERDWRKKLDKRGQRMRHLCTMNNNICLFTDRLEVDDINEFGAKTFFPTVPEEYRPPFIPKLIESTTQMKLLPGDA